VGRAFTMGPLSTLVKEEKVTMITRFEYSLKIMFAVIIF